MHVRLYTSVFRVGIEITVFQKVHEHSRLETSLFPCCFSFNMWLDVLRFQKLMEKSICVHCLAERIEICLRLHCSLSLEINSSWKCTGLLIYYINRECRIDRRITDIAYKQMVVYSKPLSHLTVCLYYRPKKFTLNRYKKYWCTFRDTHVAFYKSREEANGTPINRIDFKGKITEDCKI